MPKAFIKNEETGQLEIVETVKSLISVTSEVAKTVEGGSSGMAWDNQIGSMIVSAG